MLTNPKLVRTPDVCGGRLRLEGTRMTVNQIITLFKQGSSVEEILEQYPQRTLSEIHSILSWYFDHKDEFDRELAEEAAAEEEMSERFQRPDTP
jgi:uncharacterized protein (DUF433 family)